MPLCRVEQHTLHLFKALIVTVHQRVVQDNQGRPARLLQQVGIGQTADDAHLLARTEAQLANRAGVRALVADASQQAWSQVFADLESGLRKQQLEVAINVLLEWRLQASIWQPCELCLSKPARFFPNPECVDPIRGERIYR